MKEKKERALGTPLFLKADRSHSPKAALIRRPKRPGQHGDKRKTVTEYGRQLQEKQKIQISFGLTNKQMRTLFAFPQEKIAEMLFHRLDYVTFLLGFAKSPRIARQMVSHGHILINNRKMTIPSYHVTIGDVVTIRPESRPSPLFQGIHERLKEQKPPEWLTLFPEELRGECVRKTQEEKIQFPFDIALVGEFYSR